MEIKKPVFVYYWLCQVLYISVHRCPCLRVCVTFCAVFSFFMSDVDVFKEGSLCTLFFIGTANRDILTKELSKICKFFVLLCLRILFARDKSSLVLSLDTILKLRTVLFRNVLHKLKIFQGI